LSSEPAPASEAATRQRPAWWSICRIAIATGLLLAVHFVGEVWQIPEVRAHVALGAITPPLLWEGDFWRLWTTAFHHADVLHLLLNSLVLWQTGQLLERRWGTWRLIAFDFGAIAVSGVMQVYASPYVGLSGMAFAEFGVLAVWRKVDAQLAREFPGSVVLCGYLCLFAGIPLTSWGLISIGNVAHVFGWMYGTLAGIVLVGSAVQRTWWPFFVTSHSFLLPLIYFAIHPVWNGHYQWWLGDHALSRVQKIQYYERATEFSPELEEPWANLVVIELHSQRWIAAWERLLKFWKSHPDSPLARELAAKLENQLADPDIRAEAFQRLREQFPAGTAGELEALLQQPTELLWPKDLEPLPLWTEAAPPPGLPPIRLTPNPLNDTALPPQLNAPLPQP